MTDLEYKVNELHQFLDEEYKERFSSYEGIGTKTCLGALQEVQRIAKECVRIGLWKEEDSTDAA